ncbi:effector-associated constant component EACC1 [Chitinophaga solisilvae]|uniref:Uncharacterized protein n=1 Tax=Chitinophaga solisilvae TaxID=1233460 RepID=A0A433WPL2_9BACT|nr:hypothetical protein [Chitinophaga solisilvae]NSL88329.1 hypothetical protein [Chitinophaga solisilvae]
MHLYFSFPGQTSIRQILFLKELLQSAGTDMADFMISPAASGQMGAGEFFPILAVTVPAGLTIRALATCMVTWLRNTRCDITIRKGDQSVVIRSSRPEELETLVLSVLEKMKETADVIA